MRKNRVRLTESQLHNVIKESVKRVLREGDFDDINLNGYIDPAERQRQIDSDWKSIDNVDKRLINRFESDNPETFAHDEKWLDDVHGNKNIRNDNLAQYASNPEHFDKFMTSDIWKSDAIGTDNGTSGFELAKNRNGISESQLHNVIKESVKKVLREHEDDWFDEMDTAYIGRTSAYYDDDNESVFAPDYWTYSTDPNDPDFADEVYELNEDGKSELNWWIRSQRFNEYQRNNAFNPNDKSSEEMWEYLTDRSNGFLADSNNGDDIIGESIHRIIKESVKKALKRLK